MIRQLSYTGNDIPVESVAEILFMSSPRHYKKKLDAHRVYVASLKRKRAGETRGGLNTPASLAQCKRLKIQAELGLGDQVTPLAFLFWNFISFNKMLQKTDNSRY